MKDYKDIMNRLKNYWDEIKPNITEEVVVTTKVQKSVKCLSCGTYHAVDSEDYRVVYGDITVGLSGGIVGSNVDSNGYVYRSMVYCTDCLVDIINLKR